MSDKSANALLATVRRLTAGDAPDPTELTDAFDIVLSGDATPAQIAALLIGLRVKGETPQELASVVRSFRRAMNRLPADRPDELVDTCGTGGGTISTFNISTAAALLVAGTGIRVAKHGNRSFTTLCGSADVLEALGVSIEAPIDVMADALRDAGIVFMFAPLMHPAMRHVGPVRRELGVQTVMNLVGPLANPAGAGRQVVGVSDARRLPLIAGALLDLQSVHALVVHGTGMDEISPFNETRVFEVRNGAMSEWTIDPTRFGFGGGSVDQLVGGPPAENAATVLKVLRGEGNEASTAAVVLNAAAAFYVGGVTVNYDDGVAAARHAIKSGAGLLALDRLRIAFARPNR
ncbi:MAG TPA: anthranilate phosphoribosyltransferase [Gemmatimonadaceae bacterium]|nr:anthranilate phosphoribosyltransferase [Gemmatimonadaceae bacterium]